MYEFSVPSKRELGTWMWLSYFILFFLGKKEKGKKKKKKRNQKKTNSKLLRYIEIYFAPGVQ